jgi:hypothetical protein
MSTAERIRREAHREGRKEGRKEGREEGRVELLEQLLAAKFGELPMAVREHIRSATMTQLDRWALAILKAHSLDQVFAE